MNKQVVLVIFDGWGVSDNLDYNGIENAKKPFFDYLLQNFPHSTLKASGSAVGLPEGEMGNSEVGHTTIGAGSIVDTDVVRISKAIRDNSLCDNPALLELFQHVKKYNSTLHIQGLLSPGGVHSHQEHLYAILKIAKDAGIKKIALHLFTDGRDTSPHSAKDYIKQLEEELDKVGVGFIATVSGRYFAMDRDRNWERTQLTEDAIFKCEGSVCKNIKPSQMVKKLYDEGAWDEHIRPLVFLDDKGKGYAITKNDGVLFFNFRADRARQLSSLISNRVKDLNLNFVTMTQYDKKLSCKIAFEPIGVPTTLSDQVFAAGLTQSHIAETEKYAHVTFFLNGGREVPRGNEHFYLIESKKGIRTHDEYPQMRAKEIANKTIEEIKKGINFIVLNFANPDMVGHTGNYEATLKAIEVVDTQLKRIAEACWLSGAMMLITADHGNAELMRDPKTHEPFTAHTTNPVPVILASKSYELRNNGGLSDVAPTVLQLLGIKKNPQMRGESLLKTNQP